MISLSLYIKRLLGLGKNCNEQAENVHSIGMPVETGQLGNLESIEAGQVEKPEQAKIVKVEHKEPEHKPIVIETGMNNADKLATLRLIYGSDVICTNGLFHIIDKDRKEIYINNKTNELDRRAKYETIVVTDCVVISKAISNKDISYTILRKDNLELVYLTPNEIHYVDDNVLYESGVQKQGQAQEQERGQKNPKHNKKISNQSDEKLIFKLISHTGKILCDVPYGKDISGIVNNNKYIVTSGRLYCDSVLEYNAHDDKVRNLTIGKNYNVYTSRKSDDAVEILSMHGGMYTYNFKTHECMNEFTGSVEKLSLWSLNG